MSASATLARPVILGDIVSFKTGKLDSNAAKQKGRFPFFTCSQQTLRTNTFSFDCECVLLAGNNATGTFPIKYFRGKFDAYQRTYVIQSLDPTVLDTRYLYYALRLKLDVMKSLSTGAATKFLTLSILRSIEITLPSLSTQLKVTAVLSAYDDLIENNSRRIKLLEEMAQRIYRQWFVEFRYPGHEQTPLVNSDLGPIPEGWRIVAFTDLADILSGGTPKTTSKDYWDGEIPFFTPRDAPNTVVAMSTEKHITQSGLASCNSQLYPARTIFITARGTVGKVVWAGVPMAMNQSCYAIQGRDGIEQEFILFALLNQVSYLRTNTGGATFDTIIVDTFRRMRSVAPKREVINKFVGAVAPMIHLIKDLQDASERLRATRSLLLPRLISGEVDLADLDIAMLETTA
jgi:type I restriction enzyme, S subunit